MSRSPWKRVAPIALLLSSLAHAQYDSLVPSANPIVTEGFLVLHDDLVSLKAFSAFAQEWTTLAPTGSTLLGSGDWTAVAQDGFIHYGYSARRNETALIAITGPIEFLAVEDDMALIVSGGFAHAFSAHTGAWSSEPLSTTVTPADIGTSRFVAGIRDGTTLRGYASRPGVWGPPQTVATASPPIANGNTLLFEITDTFGFNVAIAFSGVLGIWDTTAILLDGTPLDVDHNVAHVFAEGPIVGQAWSFAYSAYSASWTANGVISPPGAVIAVSVTDNVVYTFEAGPGIHSAFGAQPNSWVNLTDPGLGLVQLDEDHLTLQGSTFGDMTAFSGLCGGSFVTQTGFLADAFGSRDHLGTALELITAEAFGFSPAVNAWAGSAAPTGPQEWDDAIGVASPAVATEPLIAYSTRYNEWMTGPFLNGAPFVQDGSVHAVLDGNEVHVWNERCNMWNPPYAFSAPPAMETGRNLILCDTPFEVETYSVQRQEFLPAPAAVTLPIAARVTEENVAHFRDAGGLLWAVGSPGTVHVWHAWPNGTEYTALSDIPTTIDFSVQAEIGDLVFALWAPDIFCPGFPFPPLGIAWLDGPTFLTAAGPLTSDDAHINLSVAANPAPCNQVWIQAIVVSGGVPSLTDHADALWLF